MVFWAPDEGSVTVKRSAGMRFSQTDRPGVLSRKFTICVLFFLCFDDVGVGIVVVIDIIIRLSFDTCVGIDFCADICASIRDVGLVLSAQGDVSRVLIVLKITVVVAVV